MPRKPKQQDARSTDPDLIRRFSDGRPRYEELCSEVAYILRKRIEKAGIEVSAVTCRAKTLKSFVEKLERKAYETPLVEITDLAGARAVCLYKDDIPLIERIVADEFEVLERVDKLAEKKPDEFGYGALHFVVRLGSKSSGARYDDLKGLVCEIQVRTVLQDAWAIVDHHLVYKSKSGVPPAIRRKLGRLSAQFEDADERFQEIRDERTAYVGTVRESIGQPDRFLATELNPDSFREYLQWRFEDVPVAVDDRQLAVILGAIQRAGYATLADLQNALDDEFIGRALSAVAEFRYQPNRIDGRVPSCYVVYIALRLLDPRMRKNEKGPFGEREVLERYARQAARGPGAPSTS